MPFLVMIAVLIGGLMMPATSLVEEKLNRTLKAVGTTSAALSEIYTAKVIAALIVSTVMGVFILVMNRALGTEPLLLILVLGIRLRFCGCAWAADGDRVEGCKLTLHHDQGVGDFPVCTSAGVYVP